MEIRFFPTPINAGELPRLSAKTIESKPFTSRLPVRTHEGFPPRFFAARVHQLCTNQKRSKSPGVAHTEIIVNSGGRLNLTGGTTVAGDRVAYEGGSYGNITSSAFSDAKSQLFSNFVNVSGSTFSSADPVEANPSLVDELYDNTFTVAATFGILGAADENVTWHVIPNVSQYRLTGDVFINTGTTLTIQSGVEVPGGSHHTFTVTYTDDVAVAFASLDGFDIRVSGPNGYAQFASFISVNIASDGTPRVATYQVSAPGGTWDEADSGTYTVAVQANQVSDLSGNGRGRGLRRRQRPDVGVSGGGDFPDRRSAACGGQQGGTNGEFRGRSGKRLGGGPQRHRWASAGRGGDRG